MDWVSDNLRILILVAGGIAYFLNTYRQAKAEERRAREERENYEEPDFTPPPRRQPSVPPPLERKSVPPPLARDFRPSPQPMAEYEAAREAATALKHQQDLAERLRQIRETKATTRGGAAATKTRIAVEKSKKPAVIGPVNLRHRLADRAELRRAIILREVLGPPVGLG